nr:tetratricopeptide repeat protein [Cupriavidus sp. SW-Y-13]
MPSPADVASAVRSEDWSKAESLLGEVLRERESPKAHYQLGQVYARQFRHAEALAEYRRAKELDPSLKFASSPKLFEAMVTREEALVEGNLDAGTSRSQSTDVAQETRAIEGTSSAAQLQATDTPSTQPQVVSVLEDWEGRMLWLIVPAALLMVVAVLMGIFRVQTSDRPRSVARLPDELEDLLKRLDSAEGVCKAASYPTGKKDLILESIWKLREDVERTVSQWRHGTSIEGVMPALVARASRLETAAETGVVTTPPVADPGDHRRVGPAVVTSRPIAQAIAPRAAVHNTETQGGGFLTGVVVGSMLSGSSPAKSAESRDESSGWYGGSGSGGGGNGGPTFDGGTGGDW